jgi:hypothetical protein
MLIGEARIPLMRAPALFAAVVLALAWCSTAAAGQAQPGSARGQVTDSSGGVLPGVTVTAAASDGRIVTSTVTDGSGGFVLKAVPAGRLSLTFQLEGFANVAIQLSIEPGNETQIVERLDLAQLSETVVVHAPPVIVPPVPPRPRIIPPPPPVPVAAAVPPHDRDSICGPSKRGARSGSLGTIASGLAANQTENFAAGAQLVIVGGRQDGLEPGRNLVVRRDFVVRGDAGAESVAEHSAGLLQIVTAGDRTSLAVVVYACDEFRKGDFLAAFNPEPLRVPEPAGTPAYRDAARILFADEGQTMGAPRRLMVIDRGTDRGTRVGQRFTLFRDRPGMSRPEIIGDAVVVAVRADSATVRIVRVVDAIIAGDKAAPHLAPVAAR